MFSARGSFRSDALNFAFMRMLCTDCMQAILGWVSRSGVLSATGPVVGTAKEFYLSLRSVAKPVRRYYGARVGSSICPGGLCAVTV